MAQTFFNSIPITALHSVCRLDLNFIQIQEFNWNSRGIVNSVVNDAQPCLKQLLFFILRSTCVHNVNEQKNECASKTETSDFKSNF